MSLTSVTAAFAGESASVRETMAETKGTIADWCWIISWIIGSW
nr:hypothetical protein [Mycoplasmopsis bovis]